MNFFFKRNDDAHSSEVDDTLQYFNAAPGPLDPDDDNDQIGHVAVRPKGPIHGGRRKRHKASSLFVDLASASAAAAIGVATTVRDDENGKETQRQTQTSFTKEKRKQLEEDQIGIVQNASRNQRHIIDIHTNGGESSKQRAAERQGSHQLTKERDKFLAPPCGKCYKIHGQQQHQKRIVEAKDSTSLHLTKNGVEMFQISQKKSSPTFDHRNPSEKLKRNQSDSQVSKLQSKIDPKSFRRKSLHDKPFEIGGICCQHSDVQTAPDSRSLGSSNSIRITKNPMNGSNPDIDHIWIQSPDHDYNQIESLDFSLFERKSKWRRIIPACCEFQPIHETHLWTGDGGDDDLRLDMMDIHLEDVHRGVMARTINKYLVMEAASCTDKIFTASLIALTMVAILVLFWFQNFGPGFKVKHINNSNKM